MWSYSGSPALRSASKHCFVVFGAFERNDDPRGPRHSAAVLDAPRFSNARITREFEQAASARPVRLVSNRLAKLGDTLGLLEDDPGIVLSFRAGGFAFVHHARVGPERNARTPIAGRIVAHNVAPFLAVDVAVTVGERPVVLVAGAVVASA